MPRILSRHNIVVADEAVMATKLNQEQLNQDADRNTKLDTANTNLVNLKNQQDGIIGAINNTTIGDATLGQRTYVYAHDTAAGQARALKCDSSGRLECSVDALEVTAETINLNTDTLETLIGTTNTKLQTDIDFAGQPNAIGDGSNMKRVMNYGHDSAGGAQRPLKVDADGHLQVDILSTTAASGTATEAKQDTQITHLSEIEGAVENVELTVGTNSATAPTRAIQIGGKYSVDGTFRDIKVDNIGKVIVDSPSGSDINTRIDAISNGQTQNGDGTGNKPGVMLDAINTNTITQNGKIDITNGELSGLNLTVGSVQVPILTNIQNAQTQDGAGGGNKLGVMVDAINTNTITQNSKIDTTNSKLDTLETTANAIQTAVELIDNCISGSEAQVDVVASLPAGTNRIGHVVARANEAADGSGTERHLLCDSAGHLQVDVVSAPSTAVTNGGLTELAAAINSNKLDVNIASNAVDFATQTTLAAAEAHLGNIETSVQTLDDVVKAEDAAHSGGDKGIMALSVRKDTATFLAGNDGDYAPLITDANGRLHVLVKKGKSYSSETSYISSQSVSGSGGTHTGSTVTNDANIKEYLFEHNFSGSDVSYEIEESIDNSSFFNALGVSFNDAGSPSASITGLNAIEIKSPFFRVKFTNGNASSRDVNLSFVSILE